MAFLSILGKVVPEELFLIIKQFESKQFLNHFLYNGSNFESRVSNASDLEPFLHNSTKFESKLLERVIFRKKMFCTAWDFEVELICTKQTLMNVLLSESHFLDLISPWKRQLLQLCAFSKGTSWWKRWKKK